MGDRNIHTLLVTANVGSLFEDRQDLLEIWVKEFSMTIKQIQPQFLALHCQEVGGKGYGESMRHVEDFVRVLMSSEELRNYGQVRVFLDEDFTCVEKFTALGNLYFVQNSLKNVQIWDFKDKKFLPVEGKEVHSGNIERVSTKEKAKFPQELFPECKKFRKGFMRTRWNICGNVIDLINIHLFHDASNFKAMESFPSMYSKNRHKALSWALHRFATDEFEKVPYFLVGDFNFRLDSKALVQKITNSTIPVHIKSTKNGEVEKVLFKDRNNENKIVLTMEKKVFDLHDYDEFYDNRWKSLQEFDKEFKMFEDELFEFSINFPPSYPFDEDTDCGTSYMRTRCPSWCDRILLSKSAQPLIDMRSFDGSCPVHYQLIGGNVTMGDHKPVMLLFRLQPQTGRPPFIFKSSALESCALRLHLPGRRTVSNPPLLTSNEPTLMNRRTLSATSCFQNVHGANSPLNKVVPIIDATKLSVVWPSSRVTSHHSSSSEEWCSDVQNNCLTIEPFSVVYGKEDTSNNGVKLNVHKTNTDPSVPDHSNDYCQNCSELLEQHVPLHAKSSGSSTKPCPCAHHVKDHKCCPCVLL